MKSNYTEKLIITQINCNSCNMQFVPNTFAFCSNQDELWILANELHNTALPLNNISCPKAFLIISYHAVLIDNALLAKLEAELNAQQSKGFLM